jgi:hypothetical protein
MKKRIGIVLVSFLVLTNLSFATATPKTVTSKTQVINAIKNMKLMMDKSETELAALDEVEQACQDKFALDHPDNRQIRDALAFCAVDPLVKKYYQTLETNAQLQDLTNNSVLAANRALKAGGNYESEFTLALNFEWAWKSYESFASKKTWEVQANQIASLAKAQNLYTEGYWIAQKYNSAKAKNYLIKTKTKINSSETQPYVTFFRKAAFL